MPRGNRGGDGSDNEITPHRIIAGHLGIFLNLKEKVKTIFTPYGV